MLPSITGQPNRGAHVLKRKTLALVTAAAIAAGMATGFTANAFADDLNGAGSTLVAPLMAQWSQDFQSKSGTKVTYGAVGSGAGISQISARSVDFRSDGSGDTYGWANYLWKVSPTWRSTVGIYATSIKFPAGVGGKGNDGVTAIISSTNGAIGYISASYAIAHGLKVAAIKNAAGKYVYPNLKNIQAAGATVKHVPASNEMHIVSPSARAPKAYPISTFTYVIVPKASPKKDL